MKKLNLHDIYMLGKRMDPLGEIDWQTKIGPVIYKLWWARSALQDAAGPESPLLEVTKRAARTAISAINGVLPEKLEDVNKLDKEQTIGYQGYQITSSLSAFESVLSNEMPGVPAYIVSQKGIYRTEDLIDHADRHFPPEVVAHLPQQCRIDLCEAGKCLAFELPTACSFHLWRALETIIDTYYVSLTSSSFEADKVSLNWGAKIKALEAKKADKAITKYLDHIREQYRNPQTHPDEIVQLSEAQMLFGTAASSITQMIMAMRKAHATFAGPLSSLATASLPRPS